MISINTHEAKSRLSALLAAVEAGEIVVICRNGVPVAELRPISKAIDPLAIDPELAAIEILDDPTAPLDEEDWPDDLRP